MGTDVAAVKASLAGIQARLAAVEAEQQRVRIEGDASFIARSNVDTKNSSFLPIDQDGNRIGTLGNKSLTANPNVYHDILLNIYGRVADNAQAVIKIDAGNYQPWLVQRNFAGSDSRRQNQPDSTRVQRRAVLDDIQHLRGLYVGAGLLGPLSGAEAKIGRFGTQFTKYVWKAVDPDSYASRPETDSGDIIGDGVGLNFGWAGAHIQTFAEKNVVQNFIVSGDPGVPSRNGVLRPGALGNGGQNYLQNAIDQSAGARVTFGNPDNIVIGISGVFARNPRWFDRPGEIVGINTMLASQASTFRDSFLDSTSQA